MEFQHQPGHKRYQPIWEMLHKLRGVRGKRDGRYTLNGNVEIDEGFFTTEVLEDKKDEVTRRGVGSQSRTVTAIAGECIDAEASVVSDATKSHVKFPEMSREYAGRVIQIDEIGKVLPWVHVAIANAKAWLANIYHGIKPEFLQEHVNEFCYKFNLRYFGERPFDRMPVAATSYTPGFKSRVHNSHLAEPLAIMRTIINFFVQVSNGRH